MAPDPARTERRPGGPSDRPVDLVHLSRQSLGEAALEREVLGLFLVQSRDILARLKASGGAARREAAHRLAGSARAVGAFEVARIATAIAEGGGDDGTTLELAIGRATAYIEGLIDR